MKAVALDATEPAGFFRAITPTGPHPTRLRERRTALRFHFRRFML
jgi:hypothetical protein